jgi:hypothetical protein
MFLCGMNAAVTLEVMSVTASTTAGITLPIFHVAFTVMLWSSYIRSFLELVAVCCVLQAFNVAALLAVFQ